jgi:hypothetical protein
MFLIKTASALKSLNFSAQLIQISSYYAVWFLFQEVFKFFIFKTNYIHSTTLLIVQWNSRTFLAYRTELNMASQDPNFFNISMFFSSSVRSNRTLFYCIWMILYDVFDAFEWFLWVGFDRTELEKTVEILKKFDSVRYSKKVLEFHCKIMWLNL